MIILVVQKGSKGLFREHMIVYNKYEKCYCFWYNNANSILAKKLKAEV